MKKNITLCFLMAFVCLKSWGQYTTMNGLPIVYWDFENNNARNTTLEITPETQINSGNMFDGKFGGSINTSTNGNLDTIGNGQSSAYNGIYTGRALVGQSWQTNSADPGVNNTTYFQFTLNTTGFTGISFSFDALSSGTTSTNSPSVGVVYSVDGGNTFTSIGGLNIGNGAWYNNIHSAFSSTANNIANLKIRIYGYNGTNNKNSQLRIDNFTVFATGTTANAGTKTSIDEAAYYTGTTSGLTNSKWTRFNTFTVATASTLVLGNGGITLGNDTITGAFTVGNGGTLVCGGSADQIMSAGTSSALSTFTLSAGGSIIARNTAGLSSAGATGDIQTTTRNFSSAANYTFAGSTAQSTGIFTTTPAAQTVNNLSIANSAGVTNLQALSISSTGILTLSNGIFTTTITNSITINNTEPASVVGGSTTTFINGPLNRTLPKSLTLSSNIYNFPVGSGTIYLPFSASSLTTTNVSGYAPPILLVQAFKTSCSGTGDNITLAANNSLSTTEYWQTGLLNISNSGINKGIVSLSRPTVVSPYNVVATTANSANGKYTSKGGTPSGNSIINSNSLADNANQFYVLAQTPTVSIASVLNPASVTSCAGTASSNMALSVSGSVLISGVTIAPPTGFEISSSATGPFNSTSVTVGSGGTVSSAPVYVRLAASDGVGSYTGNISLSSTGANAQLTAISSSTVKTTPTASITPASSSACEGTAVAVNISGTSGASLNYNVNGGTNQNVILPALPFNSPTNSGTYNYTLTSVTLAGCTGTFTNANSAINIQNLPAVTAISGGAYVQTGTTLQLSNSTSGGVWSSDNITSGSVGNTGLVSGVAEGTPTIAYTVTDNTSLHCTNQSTQSVRVYNPDYITQANGNFSSAATWQIDRDDNTFVTSVPVPAASNYTSIRVQNALTLDQDFQLGTGTNFSLITGGTMNIAPNKTFSSLGTVDFGSKAVIVKSDASGTGAIGQMASSILNATNVQVERFIGSTAFATGRRAWRLLTAPLSDATINAAWQEGLVSNTNMPVIGNSTYGTLITGYGQGTAANAFSHGYDFWDAVANTTSSIRYYVPGTITGTWNSLTTLSSVKIADQPAYMLFVRGNRSVLSTGFNITTLRAKGTLQQGSFSTPVPGSNSYTLVGNPFAAPLNFDKVYTASTKIKSQFLVWNSQNGNYGAYTLVIRNSDNNYNIVPNAFNGGSSTTSANSQYIVSGEGFLVQPIDGNGGTVVINEQAKNSLASAGINPYRLLPGTDKKLYVNLNLKNSDTSVTLADGFLARFDATYDTAINEDDALKQSNFNENLGILHSGNNLIVEARPDIVKTDTVQIKLWNVVQRTYQLQVKTENFTSPTIHAFLEDSYLQTKQEISLSGNIFSVDFMVNSDTSSYSATRFRIVFQNDAAVLPVTLTSVKAAAQNGGVNVSWTVTNEQNIKQYIVQRSIDGGRTYFSVGNVAARNVAVAGFTNYQSFDGQPIKGDNLYRIATEENNGQISYSSVVEVTIGDDEKGVQITLYPNPVKPDGKVNLQLANLATGTYLVNVFSQSGQKVYEKKITISQANTTQSEDLRLGSGLAQGSYEIRINNSKSEVVYAGKLVVGR